MKKIILVWFSLLTIILSIPLTASADSAVSWLDPECFSEGTNHTFLKCNIDAGISNVFLQPEDKVKSINLTVEIQRYDDSEGWYTVDITPLQKSYFTAVDEVHEQIQKQYPSANHQDYRIKVTGTVTGLELGTFPSATAYSNSVELGYIITR